MPGKDGTGPLGNGSIVGRGASQGGKRQAVGAGPVGYCICPKCKEKVIHTAGVPCTSAKCPKCGSMMTRGS